MFIIGFRNLTADKKKKTIKKQTTRNDELIFGHRDSAVDVERIQVDFQMDGFDKLMTSFIPRENSVIRST